AEKLGRAVSLHVPAEADARRYHVAEIRLGKRRARGQLVVELVEPHTKVQQYVLCNAPVVLQVERLRLGGHWSARDVAARIDDLGDAVGDNGTVQGRTGSDVLQLVAPAIAWITHGTVGIHHFLVDAETQQVIAQRPLEVQACRLPLVEPAADAAVGGMTTL